MPHPLHTEDHRTHRIGWLRAAVLGANDGIVSTASLVAGVAASNASRAAIWVAGVAGLVAGALSMAAGEYVSVSSQADTERADLERERRELAADGPHEHDELAGIYERRGLDPALARQVAEQMMAHDALGAHARDELGISATGTARPLQAAVASAGARLRKKLTTISAPRLAKCVAMARPMPRPEPVTRAIFPIKGSISGLAFLRRDDYPKGNLETHAS